MPENAWLDGEGPLVDERRFTPWAEPGWKSWNQYSPELEFCIAATRLVRHIDGLVVETGTGQGYITRRAARFAEAYHLYESSDKMRALIPDNGPWLVMDEETPSAEEISITSLLIVDSGLLYRTREIKLWHKYAPVDSLLLMHDAGNGHKGRGMHYTHNHHRRLIERLDIDGILYKNPRGAFLGWKQDPQDKDFLKSLLPR